MIFYFQVIPNGLNAVAIPESICYSVQYDDVL